MGKFLGKSLRSPEEQDLTVHMLADLLLWQVGRQ